MKRTRRINHEKTYIRPLLKMLDYRAEEIFMGLPAVVSDPTFNRHTNSRFTMKNLMSRYRTSSADIVYGTKNDKLGLWRKKQTDNSRSVKVFFTLLFLTPKRQRQMQLQHSANQHREPSGYEQYSRNF